MNIPQTGASERMEVAREVLAAFDDPECDWQPNEADLAETLRALITPPNVAESEGDMVQTVIQNAPAHVSGKGILFQYDDLIDMVTAAVRAGIQAAHETWEPADHPSQEMMLRWLGIGYFESPDGGFDIFDQRIEKEED